MSTRLATRPPPDALFIDIADYVSDSLTASDEAWQTARYCLMDSLGCALLALNYPACIQLLGPVVPGAVMPGGARVPGTPYELDPVQAAFNIGTMIRWLDFNDTWLAAEWGHPSDNLGAILAVADYLSRQAIAQGKPPLLMKTVLASMIKAHEIQGILALENSFNQVGLDHVLLVRVASSAVVTALLSGSHSEIVNAVSNAWLDGGALRTYRHAPNTGSRKSWAAGDATSRAVRLALMALRGEMGYPSALTAPTWGFNAVLNRGQDLKYPQKFGCYVMEHILFKIAFPAEFHAQTACEAAIKLHHQVKDRLETIEQIIIETQAAAMRIIDKEGPLDNPADRDHCLQYMVAVALLKGQLTAQDYQDEAAADLRIDNLRAKMQVIENEQFSHNYLASDKRAIGNAVRIIFTDGSQTERIAIEYPLGHRRRRQEGLPLLQAKFEHNIASRLPQKQVHQLIELCAQQISLEVTPVHEFMALMTT